MLIKFRRPLDVDGGDEFFYTHRLTLSDSELSFAMPYDLTKEDDEETVEGEISEDFSDYDDTETKKDDSTVIIKPLSTPENDNQNVTAIGFSSTEITSESITSAPTTIESAPLFDQKVEDMPEDKDFVEKLEVKEAEVALGEITPTTTEKETTDKDTTEKETTEKEATEKETTEKDTAEKVATEKETTLAEEIGALTSEDKIPEHIQKDEAETSTKATNGVSSSPNEHSPPSTNTIYISISRSLEKCTDRLESGGLLQSLETGTPTPTTTYSTERAAIINSLKELQTPSTTQKNATRSHNRSLSQDLHSPLQLHEAPNRTLSLSTALEQHMENLNAITGFFFLKMLNS